MGDIVVALGIPLSVAMIWESTKRNWPRFSVATAARSG